MNLYLILIIGILLVAVFVLIFNNSTLKKKYAVIVREKESLHSELVHVNDMNAHLAEDNKKLNFRNQELEVYSSALDADKEAAERLEKAKAEASDIVYMN